jgi:hypothetical protein
VMPRFLNIGTTLAATLLALPLAAAQTSALRSLPTGVHTQGVRIEDARIQNVVVHGSGAAMEVEIQTSGAQVEPDTQTIAGPDRIIVDFPGALPAATLHALELKVNSGALKSVRAGLFFNNPPITRVVLDLAEPQSYQISATQNAIVIKLGPPKSNLVKAVSTPAAPAKVPVIALRPDSPNVSIVRTPRLQNALLSGSIKAAPMDASIPVSTASVASLPIAVTPPPSPKPAVTVTFADGMLTIHADRVTLAQVLYEVQVQTQAEIAIPSGAEQEQVISDLGPAPSRDVLAALLNGSPYNFIFVGNESALERVILTRRDPNSF